MLCLLLLFVVIVPIPDRAVPGTVIAAFTNADDLISLQRCYELLRLHAGIGPFLSEVTSALETLSINVPSLVFGGTFWVVHRTLSLG